MAETNTERVKFKLFHMPCCGQLLCWVNPRLPNFCPECRESTVGGQLLKECVLYSDDEAILKYQDFQFMRGKNAISRST